MLILYQWIFAHLFGDFGLQTKKMVEHKRRFKARSWVLYVHSIVHGGLIYLFSPDKRIWIIPVLVIVTHFLIDLWKLNRKNSGFAFVADQILHIVVLIILWFIFYQPTDWLKIKMTQLSGNINLWIITTGYMFIVFPLAYMLGFATARWRNEVETDVPRSNVSLSEAGKWIGIFERILVFTFVLTTHFEGIGFLIAAKSILRFNDIKGDNVRKEAEYVLIGTLMSFSASILTALAVKILIT